jgi:hypothetical protein
MGSITPMILDVIPDTGTDPHFNPTKSLYLKEVKGSKSLARRRPRSDQPLHRLAMPAVHGGT